MKPVVPRKFKASWGGRHAMIFARWITGAVTIGAGVLIGSGLSAPAQAGYIVALTQQGSNVVAAGSGTLDLTDLTFGAFTTAGAGMEPAGADITTGPRDAADVAASMASLDQRASGPVPTPFSLLATAARHGRY
jgi:hypothetical protein